MAVSGLRVPALAEADLAEVWRQQAFRRKGLRGTNGLRIGIVYPGRPAGAAGPDFREAIVSLADATLLKGDVELHCDETDWWRHGHHRDTAYNQVILHVVLTVGRPAVKANGEPILTLELGERLFGHRRPSEAVQAAPPGQLACRRVLRGQSGAEIAARLEQLARQRFQDKAARFEAALAVVDPPQALYQGLMQALGFGGNRQAFSQLAGLAPYSVVEGLLGARPAPQGALLAEQLLLGVSGLVDRPPLYGLPRQAAGAWRLQGLRPGNHPAARIRAFSRILAELSPAGLLPALLGPLETVAIRGEPRPGDVRALRARWQGQLGGLGRQRADEIAVNVLLPFAAALGETMQRYLIAEAALPLFLMYPAAGGNQVTRNMRELLAVGANELRKAAGEQALLQAWEQWCRQKTCRLCPLGRPAAGGR
ncbi:MAG: DUF2851 family protein [Chloroflexota bacterium]|nr:DUF2851 family protein [Chloroflexota bacterium]